MATIFFATKMLLQQNIISAHRPHHNIQEKKKTNLFWTKALKLFFGPTWTRANAAEGRWFHSWHKKYIDRCTTVCYKWTNWIGGWAVDGMKNNWAGWSCAKLSATCLLIFIIFSISTFNLSQVFRGFLRWDVKPARTLPSILVSLSGIIFTQPPSYLTLGWPVLRSVCQNTYTMCSAHAIPRDDFTPMHCNAMCDIVKH